MKFNKTILLTGLFVSAIGLVGCSSGTADINKAVDINKQTSTIESVKKNSALADYTSKSGLIFDWYNYYDEYSGLEIQLNVDQDENASGINILLPVISKEDLAFKEQLSLAINAFGGTDDVLKSIYNKIEECLDETSNTNEQIQEELTLMPSYNIDIPDNKDLKVAVSINNPGKHDALIRIVIDGNKDGAYKYVESSKIKFQTAERLNLDTNLTVSQYSYTDGVNINLSIPLENIKDTEFRNQLKIAIQSIGGTDEDFKNTISTIESKLDVDVVNNIKTDNNSIIDVTLIDVAADTDFTNYYIDVYLGINNSEDLN